MHVSVVEAREYLESADSNPFVQEPVETFLEYLRRRQKVSQTSQLVCAGPGYTVQGARVRDEVPGGLHLAARRFAPVLNYNLPEVTIKGGEEQALP